MTRQCRGSVAQRNQLSHQSQIFPTISSFFFQFCLSFPDGKTETVAITRRRMFARTLWRSRPFFAPMKSCSDKIRQSAARLLCQLILHMLWPCPWNISQGISCLSKWFLSNMSSCTLAPCLWDMLISKHKLAAMPQQDLCIWTKRRDCCKYNGSDGAIFSRSSEASNSSTQNVRQIEAARSGKDEANKRLYKIWPLWQKIAIETVFLHVTETFAHHFPSGKDKACNNTKG